MSQFGKPLPNPVTESTAIEIQRREGTARSQILIGTGATASGGFVAAGNLMKWSSSGLIQTVGGEDPQATWGVLLYQGVSGSLATVIKGRVRVYWDGSGTVTPGSEIASSATYSGWFTGLATGSGPSFSIGLYAPFPGGTSLAAANSGMLQPVELW